MQTCPWQYSLYHCWKSERKASEGKISDVRKLLSCFCASSGGWRAIFLCFSPNILMQLRQTSGVLSAKGAKAPILPGRVFVREVLPAPLQRSRFLLHKDWVDRCSQISLSIYSAPGNGAHGNGSAVTDALPLTSLLFQLLLPCLWPQLIWLGQEIFNQSTGQEP